MRPYEVMVIFGADLDEETIRSAVARYTQLIEGRGAAGPVDFWGKRRFAYELRHRWRAITSSSRRGRAPGDGRAAPGTLLADEVLRHKI